MKRAIERGCALLLAVLFSATAALGGCAALQGATAPYVVRAVNRYCAEPPSARLVVRSSVDAQLAPTGHAVRVHCAGDAEPPQ